MSSGTVVEKRILALASTARTASETSGTFSLPGDADHVGLASDTTAYTSGSLAIQLQHSLDGVNWVDVPGATGTSGVVGVVVNFATKPVLPMLRVVATETAIIATQSVYIIYG